MNKESTPITNNRTSKEIYNDDSLSLWEKMNEANRDTSPEAAEAERREQIVNNNDLSTWEKINELSRDNSPAAVEAQRREQIMDDPELSTWEKMQLLNPKSTEQEESERVATIWNDSELSTWEKVHDSKATKDLGKAAMVETKTHTSSSEKHNSVEKNDTPTPSADETDDVPSNKPHLELFSPVIVKRSNGDMEDDGWRIDYYPSWNPDKKIWQVGVRKYLDDKSWLEKFVPIEELLEWQRQGEGYRLGKDVTVRVAAFKKEGDKSVYDPTVPPVILKGQIVGMSEDGNKFHIVMPDGVIQSDISREQLDNWKTAHLHDRSNNDWQEWTITNGPDAEGWVRLTDGEKSIVRHRASLEVWEQMYNGERGGEVSARVEEQMQDFIDKAPKADSSNSDNSAIRPLSEKTRRRLKKFEKITLSPGFAKQFEKDSASIRRMFARRKAKLDIASVKKLAKDRDKRQAKRKS